MSDYLHKLFIDEAKFALASKEGKHAPDVCLDQWSDSDRQNLVDEAIEYIPKAEGNSF